MDDLLALMEGGGEDLVPPEAEDDVSTRSPPTSSSERDNRRKVTPDLNDDNNHSERPAKKKKKTPSQSSETQVDSLLKIRMLDRKVGSLDLLEYLQTRNFHSPAALAAMDLNSLNQLLIEPQPFVAPSTVCGNTNLFTVGIVFTNSGTKIAAKGNAFCVLTIGSNLSTGPTVSALLFGPSYSKYCKEIRPGMVVALDNPRLIPPKEPQQQNSKFADSTAISFSINDERRLFVVAKARDYGVCQASVKGKNAQGQWVSNARRCSAAIDTRAGKYCFQHRNLANFTTTNTANGKVAQQKGTFLQQLRQQQPLNIQPTPIPMQRAGGPLILPNNRDAFSLSSRLKGVPMQMSKLKTAPSNSNQPQPRADAMIRSNTWSSNNSKLATNSLLNPHLKPSLPNNLLKENPYAKSKQQGFTRPTMGMPTSSKQRAPLTSNGPAATTSNKATSKNKAVHDWLPTAAGKRREKGTPSSSSKNIHRGATRRGSSRKPAAKINTAAMGGFDGRVLIPQPSKIFASGGGSSRASLSSFNQQQATVAQPCPEEVLAKQREVAKQMKTSSSSNQKKKPIQWNGKSKDTATQNKNKAVSGFFGSSLVQDNDAIKTMDREAVINAKSRFASEADAEAYAESRRRVLELEQEEAKKEKSKSNKNQKQEQKVVEKEWNCRTCHKRSKKPLQHCIRSRHQVVTKRILNKVDETKEDKRTKMTSTSAADGGLVLGSGIEWTYNRFS